MFRVTVLAPEPRGDLSKLIFSPYRKILLKNALQLTFKYDGVSNFSYEDFDIKDKQKIVF